MPKISSSNSRVCLYASGSVELFDCCGLIEQFRFCTLLDANAQDGLPRQLCVACADHMRIAYDFRFQAKYAEEYFRKTTSQRLCAEESSQALLKNERSSSDADELDAKEFVTDEATAELAASLQEQVQEIDKLLLTQHSGGNDVDSGEGGSELLLPYTITSIEGSIFDGVGVVLAVGGKDFADAEPIGEEETNRFDYDLDADSSDNSLSDHFVEAFAATDAANAAASSKKTKAKPTSSSSNGALPQNVGVLVTQILETSREENNKLMTKVKEHKKAKSCKVECNICGTTFTHINSLRQHLMKHSGERPFGCDFCKKTFTRRTILNIHRRLHTGDRPYSCDECVGTFVTKEALNRHKQRDHKDDEDEKEADPTAPIDITAATNITEHSKMATASPSSSPLKSRRHSKPPQSSSPANGSGKQQCGPLPRLRHIKKPRARMLDENGKPLPSVKYCKVCHLGFPSKYALLAHQTAHDLQPRYECDVCQRGFEKKYSLLYHLQTHENAEELVQKCIKTPQNDGGNSNKDGADDDEKDDDEIDNLPLAQRIRLAAHNKLVKASGDKRRCYKPYEKRKQLGNEYKCHICQKIYGASGSLKVHLRTHSGERPFECEHCGKRFMRGHVLNIHRRQHTGERPHKCPLCPHAAITKESLVRHVLSVHGNNIDFPHLCQDCYKTFPSDELLREHAQEEHASNAAAAVAAGETVTHVCKLCSQEFATWNEYSNHIDAHDSPKPFQCGICEMRFEKKVPLLFHLEMHKASKLFKCKHCGEMQINRNSLSTHIKRVHFDKRYLDTPCPECPAMLYDICDLKQHLNEKHDFKDFNCEKCGSNFPTFVEFEKHFNAKHDSISKACLECAKLFGSRKAYERHVGTHFSF